MRVFVRTPCRLHFALIDLNGELGRVDGSLGVALDKPNITLEAKPHTALEATGERSDFVKQLATKFMNHYGVKRGALINVRSMIPSHAGLGSSTQCSLAVASVLARIAGIGEPVRGLAKVMGRGGTSGIGVAAFETGGLILDGGHSFGEGRDKQSFMPSGASNAQPAPVLARYEFPQDWMFVVALPNALKGAHGQREVEIFRERCPIKREQVAETCRTIMMKILPAVIEGDIVEFGQGLNRLQEIGFAEATKDLSDPFVEECIDFMRQNGAYGAGQSSFGPATFGLVKGEQQAIKLQRVVEEYVDRKVGGIVFCSKANNRGAIVRRFKS